MQPSCQGDGVVDNKEKIRIEVRKCRGQQEKRVAVGSIIS